VGGGEARAEAGPEEAPGAAAGKRKGKGKSKGGGGEDGGGGGAAAGGGGGDDTAVATGAGNGDGAVDGQGLPFVRGGATKFYTTPSEAACQFTPRAGYVLLHSHGYNCLLHEGAVVAAGVKYLLRTDVVYT
jgi:hypothetical protein